jgi:xanthine dehydrogenase accessory factor
MIVIVRGGGDLASGVILRLHRIGLRVAVTELPQPLAVRRRVSFAEAVFAGETRIEEVTARCVKDPLDTLRVLNVFSKKQVPVLIDPEGLSVKALHPTVVVDARMTKQPPELMETRVQLLIGLGPGFTAGKNCHAAVETNRGHWLGRVYWEGSPEADTGVPEGVLTQRAQRVLRAPADGELAAYFEIGDHLEPGQVVAAVDGHPVAAPFAGVLRGLLRPGTIVQSGLKIGDLDPRDDAKLCTAVSDKALSVGGGVIEAILSRAELRPQFWS